MHHCLISPRLIPPRLIPPRPHSSSPFIEVSDTDTNSRYGGVPCDESRHNPSRQGASNPILGDEGRPDDDFPFGRSNTYCQGEDHSKSARLAKLSSTLAGTQEMAASRRGHRPTHTTPPGTSKSSSPDSEPSGKPGPRPEAAPPHIVHCQPCNFWRVIFNMKSVGSTNNRPPLWLLYYIYP